MAPSKPTRPRPEVSLYKRNAAHITNREVLHPIERDEITARFPKRKRKAVLGELEATWAKEDAVIVQEARPLLDTLKSAADEMAHALDALAFLQMPELLGKVEAEQQRLRGAQALLQSGHDALDGRDFGTAGQATDKAAHELWLVGSQLVVPLNQALAQAAVGREQRDELQVNVRDRQDAKRALETIRKRDGALASISAASRVHSLEAQGFRLAAEILRAQVRSTSVAPIERIGRENTMRVIPPQECETFADVGGLEEIKEKLRSTIGAILERPDEAARYRVVHNGILFHGPPGTGKTLLSRALAGEYGLRYLRFSPASIASAYIHEAAANLERMFELAKANTPCVLFLDEIDTIASARDDHPSADHREVVTQLMNALEEYRSVPGLVIIGATNNIDRLDPGLREGRFDAKILIPFPDPQARQEIIRVHLERRRDAVNWSDIDLAHLSRLTRGRNAAALEAFVVLAAQQALSKGTKIGQEDLVEAIHEREGRDRRSLDQPVSWRDVVLPEDTREQLMELVNVFSNPEMAQSLGIQAPAGILLHGPPGTGKTTIAKAMATEIQASFYEQSAGDLLSKWAGESEERVMKLFAKARANRPSIIFIDEIDSLLRRRSSDSATPWEERVISQFLRELDGLAGSEGVFLVGATNRLDIIDPAIQGRRLTPLEIGLPDTVGRLQLLKVLCRDVTLAADVDLKTLATGTEGMSGADLKRLRDSAGMKALSRVAKREGGGTPAEMTMSDLRAALDAQRNTATLVQV